jgi:hypothetical protein
VNQARDEAESDCAQWSRPGVLIATPGWQQADQQWYERDPREGGMPEPREAEGQQDAGQEG